LIPIPGEGVVGPVGPVSYDNGPSDQLDLLIERGGSNAKAESPKRIVPPQVGKQNALNDLEARIAEANRLNALSTHKAGQ